MRSGLLFKDSIRFFINRFARPDCDDADDSFGGSTVEDPDFADSLAFQTFPFIFEGFTCLRLCNDVPQTGMDFSFQKRMAAPDQGDNVSGHSELYLGRIGRHSPSLLCGGSLDVGCAYLGKIVFPREVPSRVTAAIRHTTQIGRRFSDEGCCLTAS